MLQEHQTEWAGVGGPHALAVPQLQDCDATPTTRGGGVWGHRLVGRVCLASRGAESCPCKERDIEWGITSTHTPDDPFGYRKPRLVCCDL